MQIEVLGLVAFGFGLLGWVVGPGLSILVFFVSTLLGAAAAVTVTALGDANIQPAHLMLGFVTIAALANRDLSGAAARALSFPRAGFWLLLTGAYTAVSAVIFPRLFAGATYVFAIARTVKPSISSAISSAS